MTDKNEFDTVITAKPRFFDLHLKEIFRYKDLCLLFVKRDFKAGYKQTILGPVWAIIQPLLTTVMFFFVFGKLQQLLEKFMINSISVFDGTGESFYHGMMLGLWAVLNTRYRIKSNAESGYGRFDIALIPINKSDPGFIFEFKYAGKDSDGLESLADAALAQIEEKKYETELLNQGVTKIIKTGIAFKGKKALVRQK